MGKDKVVATCGLRESLMTKVMLLPFAPDPLQSWGRRGPSTQAEPGRRSWPRHLNEGGHVGLPPGSADGSCIEEADKKCVFG